VFLAKGDLPNAIREFTKVIQSDPAQCGALNGRGTALRKIGNYEQSSRDLSQAIQFEPGESDHYLERGLTYIELKDYEKALFDFAQAASLAPASSAGFRNRGMVFALRGEHDKAISEYDRAIQVNSAYAPNFLARAKSYRSIGKEVEASIDESRAAQIENQERRIEKQEKTFLAYLDAAKVMYSEGFTKAYSISDRDASVNIFKAIGYPIFVLIMPLFFGIFLIAQNSDVHSAEYIVTQLLLTALYAPQLVLICLFIAIAVFVKQISGPRNRRKAYEKYATKISSIESSMPSFGRFYELYLEARGKSEMNTLTDKARPLLAEVSAQEGLP
jgi:Flp pilus assembly protein TadD